MADPREAGPRKISRRQFLFTAAETAAAALLAACAPTPTPDAPTSTSAAKATSTETPAPTQTATLPLTETPKPTEIPVEIIGVEVKTVAQNREIIDKLQRIPLVHNLTSGSDIKHNEAGNLIDMWGRIMPELVPDYALINAKTKDGHEQHIFVVRHPEQDLATGDIKQSTYLITGQGNDGKYIDPTLVGAENIVALPITAQNGVWSVIDPENNTQTEFTRLNGQKGTVVSPFGGAFEFDVNNVKMFGLQSALDYTNHPIMPLDLTYKLLGSELTSDRAVLGDNLQEAKLPWCKGPEWIYGGHLYRTTQHYLEVLHPELVDEVLKLNPVVSFELKKDNSNKVYWLYNWNPLDMPPILRFRFLSWRFNDNPEQGSSAAYVEVVPDNSKRGWGVLTFIGSPNEPNYASTGKPMPTRGYGLYDNKEKMMAAAKQLTDPSDPNFGIIPLEFSHNFIA